VNKTLIVAIAAVVIVAIVTIGAVVVLTSRPWADAAPQAPSQPTRVECRGDGNENFVCNVTRGAGEPGQGVMNVCWNVNVTCANGLLLTAHACVPVGPYGSAQHVVPFSVLANNAGTCDHAQSLSVGQVLEMPP
jgi:hypothetical protein